MNTSIQTITLRERIDQALSRLQTENAEMKKAVAMWLWLKNNPGDYNWTTSEQREKFAELKLKIAVAKKNRIAALRDEFEEVWLKEYNIELCRLWQAQGVNINS